MTFSLENTFRFTIDISNPKIPGVFFRKEAEFEWNGLEMVFLKLN